MVSDKPSVSSHRHELTILGPLVRINPDELHFNDPYFYDTIYAGSLKRRNKDKSHAAMAGLANATSVTIDHDLHRQRRGYIANLFSKRSILRLEGLIQAKVDKLVLKLRDAHANKDTLLSISKGICATRIRDKY
jgi:cytochrome P450